jgi:nifR3 family TIM-barrel protein
MKRIGTVTLDPPFLLGGLAGYGDPAFRRLCLRAGASACVTPMILDRAVLALHPAPTPHETPAPQDHPVFAQIVGSDPGTMARAAVLLEKQGFDGVDLNLACPAPKVIRKMRGGALLKDPARARAVFEAVREAVSVPVTAKLRRAFDDTPLSEAAFHEVVEAAVNAGLDALTLHPRSVEQRFRGSSRWASLAELRARHPGTIWIGSGDVWTPEDAVRMIEETGVDAVCAGRGALGNPLYFRRARALHRREPAPRISGEEQAAWLAEYADVLFAQHAERKALILARKTGIKAARHAPAPKRVREAFASAQSRADLEKAIEAMRGT